MFKMISRYGNEVKFVNDEAKREELIELGFTEVKEKSNQPHKKPKKAVKKNEIENTN